VSFIANVRKKMFWSFDRFNGGMISQAYKEMKKLNEVDSKSVLLVSHQNKALHQLLKHAADTIEYYNRFARDRNQLADFPVINKNMIRENQEIFLSKAFHKDELYKMLTSGSTGTPFVCYQDKNKKSGLMLKLSIIARNLAIPLEVELSCSGRLSIRAENHIWISGCKI
jgi:phenylacetate-CoA ligase